jgi:hypothetical protein
VKYAWIDGQQGAYPLPALCATLGVSPSGFHAWKRGGTANRKRLSDPQMLTLIRAIHAELKGAYGSPRMVREIRGRGFPASKARIERLMRETASGPDTNGATRRRRTPSTACLWRRTGSIGTSRRAHRTRSGQPI